MDDAMKEIGQPAPVELVSRETKAGFVSGDLLLSGPLYRATLLPAACSYPSA